MAKARTAPAWRRVFLRALGTSGNVKLAARTAGIDRVTAYALRRRDAAFGKGWVAAKARAEARAAVGTLKVPAAAKAPGAGLAGLVVRHSRNAGTQVVRAGPGRWSAGTERAFLEALAKTACVRRAAEAVGLSTTAVYARRKADAGLAGRWAAALGAGEERIGEFLTAAVLAAFDPEVAAAGVPAASVAEAIAIARLKGVGRAQAAGAQAGVPDFETAKASILRKIEAIERADARKVSAGAGAGGGEEEEDPHRCD